MTFAASRRVARTGSILACLAAIAGGCGLTGAFPQPLPFMPGAVLAQAAAPPSVGSGHTIGFPLAYVPNVGQSSPGVRYVVHAPSYSLYLEDHTIVFRTFVDPPDPCIGIPGGSPSCQEHPQDGLFQLGLPGSHPGSLRGEDRLPADVNYYLGSDPSQWHTQVPAYGQVLYRNVYPQIDLLCASRDGSPWLTWIVHPGGRPSRIALAPSIQPTTINHQGHVMLGHTDFSAVLGAPRASQPQAPGPIHSRYVVSKTGVISIAVGPYDRHQPLVLGTPVSPHRSPAMVPPVMALAVAPSGDIVLAGTMRVATTLATPVLGAYTGDAADVVVALLGPEGRTLRAIAYLGGSNYDVAGAVGFDAAGHVYVTGSTNSPDFPVRAALQSSWIAGWCFHGFEGEAGPCDEAFTADLSPALDSITYSTYLGAPGETTGEALAVDGTGDAYVAGGMAAERLGPGPPVNSPASMEDAPQHCFVVGLDPAGQVVGQAPVSDLSPCTGIAFGPQGTLDVSGVLTGFRPPARQFTSGNETENGAGNGTFVAGVAIGAPSREFYDVIQGMSSVQIAAGSDGSLYATGGLWDTTSFPATIAPSSGAAGPPVLHLSAAGDTLLSARVLDPTCLFPQGGPPAGLVAYGMALDRSGHIWLTGGAEGPILGPPAGGSASPGFVLEVDAATGQITACGHVGPPPDGPQGNAIALDRSGGLMVGGTTGGVGTEFVGSLGSRSGWLLPGFLSYLPASTSSAALPYAADGRRRASMDLGRSVSYLGASQERPGFGSDCVGRA